jgi:hypothetical protein
VPYISDDHDVRGQLARGERPPQSAGQLAYALTLSVRDFLNYVREASLEEPRWEDLADVVKALEAVKFEFERRVLSGYEDRKIAQNGDVDWGVSVS